MSLYDRTVAPHSERSVLGQSTTLSRVQLANLEPHRFNPAAHSMSITRSSGLQIKSYWTVRRSDRVTSYLRPTIPANTGSVSIMK